MPTYPVKNLKTGETQELSMTMSAYDEWREENPDWDKDWSKGCAGVGEVGEWQEKLVKKKLTVRVGQAHYLVPKQKKLLWKRMKTLKFLRTKKAKMFV